MSPLGDDNIIRLKKRRADPESNYRPEKLGRNRMKVTQLSTARLPQLLHSSPQEKEEGDRNGEKTEKGRYASLKEAREIEVEVAVGSLLGSRLNVPSWERLRKRGGCGEEPGKSSDSKENFKKSRTRKDNKQDADQEAPG